MWEVLLTTLEITNEHHYAFTDVNLTWEVTLATLEIIELTLQQSNRRKSNVGSTLNHFSH